MKNLHFLSKASLETSEYQNFLYMRVTNPLNNPQLGGPGCLASSGSSPLTCPVVRQFRQRIEFSKIKCLAWGTPCAHVKMSSRMYEIYMRYRIPTLK